MSLTKFLSVTMCLVSVLSTPVFAGQASSSSDSKGTGQAGDAAIDAASTNNKNVEMRNGFKVFYGKWNRGVRLGCGVKEQTFSPGTSVKLKLIFQCREGKAQLHVKFAPYIQNNIQLIQKKSRQELALTKFGKAVRAAGPVNGSTAFVDLSPEVELSSVLLLNRVYDLSVPEKCILNVSRSIYIRMEDGYRKVDCAAPPILLKIYSSGQDDFISRFMTDKQRNSAIDWIKSTGHKTSRKRIEQRQRKAKKKGRESNGAKKRVRKP